MRDSLIIFSLLMVIAFSFSSCDDPPPETIIVPPYETPRSVIDNYYYVKFGWGPASKKDTIVMEVPDVLFSGDSIAGELDEEKDFYMEAFDFKNEPILDTNGAKFLEDLGVKPLRFGWTYAPTCVFFNGVTRSFIDADARSNNYDYWSFTEDEFKHDFRETILNDELEPEPDNFENEEYVAFRNIFFLSFPWNVENDTFGFWDISDYLANPSIKEGTVKWGRIGNSNTADTLWNNDAQNGAMMHYRDKDGVVWESDNPPTFQNGSYFVITEKTHWTKSDGNKETYFVIAGEFSANLYNENGEYLRATGEFRMNMLTDIDLSKQPE